jgi:hypothetical protein
LRLYGVELLRFCLFAPQFELQSPAVRGVPRFTPEFERANLRETGSETHNQMDFAHFLAVAQQGRKWSVTMNVRFVQCNDFALRIVARA